MLAAVHMKHKSIPRGVSPDPLIPGKRAKESRSPVLARRYYSIPIFPTADISRIFICKCVERSGSVMEASQAQLLLAVTRGQESARMEDLVIRSGGDGVWVRGGGRDYRFGQLDFSG